jgi:hypothetical protein
MSNIIDAFLASEMRKHSMRWLVGVLLLISSTLKGYQLLVDPSVLTSSTADRIFLFLQVAFEYGLALLVLSGLYWQRLRWIVLVLFICLAAYSLLLAILGAASCGCFGPVKVSPWLTFLLDTAIVLGLLLSVRNRIQNTARTEVRFSTKNQLLAGGALFLVPVIALSTSVLVSHGRTSADSIIQVGGLTILEPDNWIGQKLPIASFIDIDLTHGRWTVLLHRHDCPQCQQELPKYEQLAYEKQVALVEVPPFGDISHNVSGVAAYGRLADEREWFVQTPVEIILEDGIVVAASNHHE